MGGKRRGLQLFHWVSKAYAPLFRPQPRTPQKSSIQQQSFISQPPAKNTFLQCHQNTPPAYSSEKSKKWPGGRRFLAILERWVSSSSGASSTLLFAEEDMSSVLGLGDGEVAAAAAARGLDFLDASGGAVFPVDSDDEAVRLLTEKEMDYRPKDGYAERLQQGGFESSWRKDAVDWICKVHSYYNFGPLSLCLSVNYLDRFLDSFNLPHDKSWMQHLMSVACLSVAVKMEETVVPLLVDLQVCDPKYEFEARNIKRMELLVMETLKWRMQAVTPFSFMCYFLDKFNEGKPPSYMLASRCAELIVDTVKDSRFLAFRPSEIAAAVVLSALVENQVVGFNNTLAASEIPVNKEMIARCYELLVKKRGDQIASSSVPHSPIAMLDAACFSFRSDDSALGSSQPNNNGNNNDQASTPASKRRRLSTSPI